jgi:CheY-like chemotaxis protein
MDTDPRLILVVDDDADLRSAYRAYLEYAGYRVQEAANGTAALRELGNPLPRLIILDLTMPVMDGPAFVAALRQRGPAFSIPVLLVSANDDLPRVAEQLGAAGYLKKPLRGTALAQELARLLPG